MTGRPLDTREGRGLDGIWNDSWLPRRDEVAQSDTVAKPVSPSFDTIRPQVIASAQAEAAGAYARIEAEKAVVTMNAQADNNQL